MSSTNYAIEWDSINSGGEDSSSSTNYQLRDTVGEHGTGISSSENYTLGAGYRQGDSQDPFLSIAIGTQENSVQTTWTNFSNSTSSVTVASAGSFSTSDYIGVIENRGFGQLVAVGKISGINGNVISVDDWEGEPASLSAVASGGDDYVYRMNGNAAQLGVQTVSTESTSMTLTDIATNANNGYTVSVQGDTDLSYSSVSITNVSDGTVSVDAEEYGIETVGTLGVGTGSDLDIPTSTTRTIQNSSTYASEDRVAVIYKLSVDAVTPAGDYTQTVLYRVTGNF
ncbi:hypothetical protein GF380_06250 [Candidatus Uhrbacteria bacterium]|nr:hypothetical protein [Candidatus Uhrbacteria bacterium]MBD3284656.1 hypothetical protein [Candidatus Uhrbacteria bacterium]